jgi:hypothetical protein
VKPSRVLLATIVSAVAALALCANAGATNVIVGPSLTGSWEPEECVAEACTFINAGAGAPEVTVRSPVDGAIVRWSMVGASAASTYRLGTTLQFGETDFTFRNWTAPVSPSVTAGVQSFPTHLPVEKGMSIALAMSEEATLGFREGDGQLIEWGFEPEESGNAVGGEIFPEELAGFNAEIQPAPAISSISPTSAPSGGGTTVTITGTDLENATSVIFGGTPASITVDSETQITAVTGSGAESAVAFFEPSTSNVPVTVTTIAGTVTASQQFGIVTPASPRIGQPVPPTPAPQTKKRVKQCVVPKLKGKKLPAAQAALKKADCKAGKVTKLKGATPKNGKVATQSRKPGAKAAAGAKVNLTLKP